MMSHYKFLTRQLGREPVLPKTEFGSSNIEKREAIIEVARRMT